MDAFLAICQGIGLALAAGVGGMLAVLLMSVLAHVDVGWDLDGTDFKWFETEWFIPLLFALNVVVFLIARSKMPKEQAQGSILFLTAAFGAVVCMGSMAEETSSWFWLGIFGAVITALTFETVAGLLAGATARSPETAGTLQLILAGAGLVLVLVALFLPPLSLVAVAGVAVLAAGRRRRADEKYEGLRSLR